MSVGAKMRRQRPRAARRADERRGIVRKLFVMNQVPRERPQRREPPGRRRAADAPLVLVREIAADAVGVGSAPSVSSLADSLVAPARCARNWDRSVSYARTVCRDTFRLCLRNFRNAATGPAGPASRMRGS